MDWWRSTLGATCNTVTTWWKTSPALAQTTSGSPPTNLEIRIPNPQLSPTRMSQEVLTRQTLCKQVITKVSAIQPPHSCKSGFELKADRVSMCTVTHSSILIFPNTSCEGSELKQEQSWVLWAAPLILLGSMAVPWQRLGPFPFNGILGTESGVGKGW